MAPSSLLIFALLTSVPTPRSGAFEMPPPPPGMRELSEAEKAKRLGAPAGGIVVIESSPTADEEPEDSQEIDEESAELEAMRAAEQLAIDPVAAPDAQLLQSLRRLGIAHPVRQRLLDNFDDP